MNLNPQVARCCAAATLSLLLSIAAHAHRPVAPKDSDAIRHVLVTTFDQPQVRLRVEPIVIQGDHAIAGWTQGERGGRALLKRKAHGKGWDIALCAGDGLKDATMLRDTGLSAADAKALVHSLASAESTLSHDVLIKFSRFDGVVRMGPNGEHPPVHDTDAHQTDGNHRAH